VRHSAYMWGGGGDLQFFFKLIKRVTSESAKTISFHVISISIFVILPCGTIQAGLVSGIVK
jgi:hypothetical protein